MSSHGDPSDAIIARIQEQVGVAARRLERLDGDVRDSSRGIGRSGRDESRFVERFEQDLVSFRAEVSSFADELESFRREVAKVASRFKSLVENENLSAVEQRLDDLPVERFMPRQEFLRLLEGRFRP
ncbi:MAG: hypothetical protein ACLFO2_00995 [Candidatus Woesearchaeota archaeon]